MNSDKTVQDLLYDYLSVPLLRNGYSASSIYYGYSQGVEILGKKAVLLIQDIEDDFPPEVRERYFENPDKTIQEQVWYRYTVNCSIDLFGKESLANTRHVKAFLYSSEAKDLAYALQIGFKSYSSTLNLGYITKGGYIPRNSFSVSVHLTTVYLLDIQTIGQVRIIGHDSDTGRLMVNEVITET